MRDRPALYDTVYLALMAVLVVAVFLGLERLLHGPWGRALKAVREDETAAAALGKDPRRFRLEAFVMGSAVMGLAGAAEAHFTGFIAPAAPLARPTPPTMLAVPSASFAE